MCSLYKVLQSGVIIQSRGEIRSSTSYFDLILGSEWLEFQLLRSQFWTTRGLLVMGFVSAVAVQAKSQLRALTEMRAKTVQIALPAPESGAKSGHIMLIPLHLAQSLFLIVKKLS